MSAVEISLNKTQLYFKPETQTTQEDLEQAASVALKFRIRKINRHGAAQDRVLEVDVFERTLRCLTNHKKIRREFSLVQILRLERHKEEATALKVVFKDLPPYYVYFRDGSTRESFVALLLSVNEAIVEGWTRPASRWVEDSETKNCMRCDTKFTVSVRRHHCRACGHVVCAKCSSQRALLPHAEAGKLQSNIAPTSKLRVCDICYDIIRDSRIATIASEQTQLSMDSLAKKVSQQPVQPKSKRGTIEPERFDAEKRYVKHGEIEEFPVIDLKRVTMVSLDSSDDEETDKMEAPKTNRQVDAFGFFVKQDADEDRRKTEERYAARLNSQRKRWEEYLANHGQLNPKDPVLKQLIRTGIPPEMRGRIWQTLARVQEKRAHESSDYYDSLVQQGKNAPYMKQIEKDLLRTFPDHVNYHAAGEGIGMLRRILGAYSVRNPLIGYCQSLNFIVALFLLFMEEQDAFWMLTVLVEDIAYVPTSASEYGKRAQTINPDNYYYYQTDLAGIRIDQQVFCSLVFQMIPRLDEKLKELMVPLEPLTVNWFLCMFVHTLPLELVLRVWDCMFSEGIKTVFRAGLCLLKTNEKQIFKAGSMDQLITFLRSYCHSSIDPDQFMKVCFKGSLGSFSMKKIHTLREQVVTKMGPMVRKPQPLTKPKAQSKPEANKDTKETGKAALDNKTGSNSEALVGTQTIIGTSQRTTTGVETISTKTVSASTQTADVSGKQPEKNEVPRKVSFDLSQPSEPSTKHKIESVPKENTQSPESDGFDEWERDQVGHMRRLPVWAPPPPEEGADAVDHTDLGPPPAPPAEPLQQCFGFDIEEELDLGIPPVVPQHRKTVGDLWLDPDSLVPPSTPPELPPEESRESLAVDLWTSGDESEDHGALDLAPKRVDPQVEVLGDSEAVNASQNTVEEETLQAMKVGFWPKRKGETPDMGEALFDPKYIERFKNLNMHIDALEVEDGRQCAGCGENVRDDQSSVYALDKMWHADHFRCAGACNRVLGGSAYYQRNGKPLCKDEYFAQYGKRCARCKEFVLAGIAVDEGDSAPTYHYHCLACAACGKQAENPGAQFYIHEGQFYCQHDYEIRATKKCVQCGEPITHGLIVQGQPYHTKCLHCVVCQLSLATVMEEKRDILRSKITDHAFFCALHIEKGEDICLKCNEPLAVSETANFQNSTFHRACLACTVCHRRLEPKDCSVRGHDLYCEEHFERYRATLCSLCQEPLGQLVVKHAPYTYHVQCFVCSHQGCTSPCSPSSAYVDPITAVVFCANHRPGAPINKISTADTAPPTESSEADKNPPRSPDGDTKSGSGLPAEELCCVCKVPLTTESVMIRGNRYHRTCVRCCICGADFPGGQGIYAKESSLYCRTDYIAAVAPKCSVCDQYVTSGRLMAAVTAHGTFKYHADCFACSQCGNSLVGQKYALRQGGSERYALFCEQCTLAARA